jgi:hypothetical protein
MEAMNFEAIKVAIKQDATGYVLTLRIHPDEVPEQLLRDFVGARYGAAMVRINDDETPAFKHIDETVKKAGMLCRSKNFQNFMQENFDSELTEKSAAEAIHKVCFINSRSELATNQAAKKIFNDLLNEYDIWSQTHDDF